MDQKSKFDKIIEKLAGRVTNIVLLGFFSTLFCLPIVTVGASLTAVHVAMDDYLNHENQKPLKVFFKSFKQYFKLSTIVWLLHLLIIAVLAWDYLYYSTGTATMDYLGRAGILTVSTLLIFEMVMVFIVIGCDLATTVKDAFAKAFDIAFTCFWESIEIIVFSLAVPIVAVFLFGGLILVIPGVVAFLDWQILPKMLKKYRFKKGNREYQREQRDKK